MTVCKKWIQFAGILLLTYFSMAGILFCRQLDMVKNNDIQVEVCLSGSKNTKSQGYEARILKITIDGQEKELATMEQPEDGITYEDHMLVLRGDNLVLTVSQTADVSIQFLKHAWSGIIRITVDGNETEEMDLYQACDDTDLFHYKWKADKAWRDAFLFQNVQKRNLVPVFAGLFLVHSLCIGAFGSFLRRIQKEMLSVFDLLKVSIAAFITALLTLYVMLHLFREWLVVFFSLFILAVLYKNRNIIQKQIAYAFVLLYLPAAICMIFLLPPGHVLDEFAHFIKAYEASVIGDSHTTLLKGKEAQGKVYIYLPTSIEKLNQDFVENQMEYGVQYDLEKYFENYTEKLNKDQISEKTTWFGNTAHLNRTSYLPSILAAMVCVQFSLPPLFMFQIMRFVNMLLFYLMGFSAIRILPRYRRVLLLILLLPMMLQESVGINQDWLTNSAAFLTVAYILKVKNEKVFQKKDFIVMLLLSFFIGNVKPVYACVLLLVFIIPAESFENKRKEYFSKIIILLSGIVLSAITCIVTAGTVQSDGELPYYAAEFVWKHPFQTAGIYIETFLNDGMYHFQEGLLTGLGWYTHYCKSAVSKLCGNILFLLLLGAGEYSKDEKAVRFLSGVIFAVTSALVYTSMFLGWTTIDSKTVSGLQPRYFMIPLFCLGIAVQNQSICIRIRHKNFVYAVFAFGFLCTAVWTVAVGFYR